MPILHSTFSLVADRDGKVQGQNDQNPPFNIKLRNVTVRSTSGCRSRSHNVTAGFRGGATFNYTGTLTDCTDLYIDLNDLPAPGGQTTSLVFELDGFDVGETVQLEGDLEYALALFAFAATSPALVASAATPVRSTERGTRLDLLRDALSPSPVIPPEVDGGARINRAKSLIFQWFSLFDIRSRKVSSELAGLLDDPFEIHFPDATLKTRQEFLDWYEKHFALVKRGYHELDNPAVKLLGDEASRVMVHPNLHVETPSGDQISQRFLIEAELHERNDGVVRIHLYTAKVIT